VLLGEGWQGFGRGTSTGGIWGIYFLFEFGEELVYVVFFVIFGFDPADQWGWDWGVDGDMMDEVSFDEILVLSFHFSKSYERDAGTSSIYDYPRTEPG
jgi:hypothetical protein